MLAPPQRMRLHPPTSNDHRCPSSTNSKSRESQPRRRRSQQRSPPIPPLPQNGFFLGRKACFLMVFAVSAKADLCTEKPRLSTANNFLSTGKTFLLTANDFVLTANSFLLTAKARLFTANSFLLAGRKAPCTAFTKPRNGVVAPAKKWSKAPANWQI